MSIEFPKINTRGKGYWKFNNDLLHDRKYVKLIKETLSKIKTDDPIENKNISWEYTKCQIRTETLYYSIQKKKNERKLEEKILNKIEILEKNLENEINHIEYLVCKRKWENLQRKKTSGIIQRAKAKWVEEGEKNTSYFVNLEKRNYNATCIKLLINKEKQEITKQKEIIDEQKQFYSTLYETKLTPDEKREINETNFTSPDNIPKLNDIEKESCDMELSLQECTNALKKLANNKSPGIDGLTTEFYKFFWIDIKDMLYNSYLYSFEHNSLSQDQKRGILNLLPKNDKDLRYLANWRPVSLLTTDYKILTKALAMRLQKVIETLISSDQVGYIKNRYIGENIRIIFDIMKYAEEEDIEAYLAQIDFEKAFDSIEWPFLLKVLEHYNFGENFRRWIKILYTDIQSCVGNNGHYSEFFNLSRSIRQGCPISALLFLLVAEIIAIDIREDHEINGININGTEFKISLMADDTTLTLINLNHLRRQYQDSRHSNATQD